MDLHKEAAKRLFVNPAEIVNRSQKSVEFANSAGRSGTMGGCQQCVNCQSCQNNCNKG